MHSRTLQAVMGITVVVLLLAGLGTPSTRAESLGVVALDQKQRPVQDAVFVLYPADGDAPAEPSEARAVVDQVGQQFVPYVSAVRVGTAVAFPNNDDIRHHVYSFSEAKKFELPLYKGVPADPVVFDTAGTVVLGCNIHDWMLAYVYVVDTPWRAVTDAKGAATFDNLPPGPYRVEVLHPRLKGEVTKDIDFPDGVADILTFEMKLRPDFRRSRAPRAGDSDYN